MTAILDLENSANWQPREAQSFVTAPETPIPNWLSTQNFNSNIIGVLVDNSAAKPTWHFAGWLSQHIFLPFGPGSDDSATNDRRLWLRRKQLLIFPAIAPVYRISVRFPRWFTQASITIWEYQGPQGDSIETQLNQIETKLDTLLQQHPP